MSDELRDEYDVVVIGGGAGGLSGGLMLGRARRSVVVVDAGQPRNAPADGVHGLLGHDGIAPADLVQRGRAGVRRYGGHVVDGTVVDVRGAAGEFVTHLADGREIRSRRLLVTTGLVDELPSVAGLRERWGRDVVHCPYCHGWEVRDTNIAILASSPMSVHQALLFRQWSPAITFFTHTQPRPTDEQLTQLTARGIRVVSGEVERLVVTDDAVTGIALTDGTVEPAQTVAVATRMIARTGFLDGVGLKPVDHVSGMGEHIPVDAMGRTAVPGIWAAGNVADLSAQVGAAASAAAFAAAQINFDLVEEETRAAVAALG